MARTLFALFLRFFLLGLAQCLSPTFSACQVQKPPGESPLSGCPNGTLYVSPSDSSANFSSIQKAIDSLPETGNAVILVGEGRYFEMVKVTRRAPLTLLGQLDPATAPIQNRNVSRRNLACVWSNLHVGDGTSDEETATLTVGPSYGYPFGNVDFRVYNINFENLAANYSISQALVTCITLANVSFYGCAFASWQDTWYTGYGANTYVVDSVIYGQTDYVFGQGKAWFQSSTLANRGCGGGITAWGGTSDTEPGVYVSDSRIIRSPDAEATTVTTKSCYLGRPWAKYSVAVFLKNYMDDSIQPAGFTTWIGKDALPDTTYYAEYASYGPGGNMSNRLSQCHILNATQAEQFTLAGVFGGFPSWIDNSYRH